MSTKEEDVLRDEEGNKLFTLTEVAEKTEIKKRSLMYKIRQDRLNASKLGWQWVIKEDEVERLKEEKEDD